MITLRTGGEKTIIAQKIGAPAKQSEKRDIHELRYESNTREFYYHQPGK